MRRTYLYIVYLLAFVPPAHGQEIKAVMGLEEFYTRVGSDHPIARQAALLTQKGKFTIRQAKGSFDPKLVSDFNQKEFDGKNYYDTWDSYVRVPTLLNVDLKAGYERNGGDFLNPEQALPEGGLFYAGVSVPLGQGLINSQRLVNLRQSRVASRSYANEARAVLNNLMLDANYAYWLWYEAYLKNQIVSNSLQLITDRFELVRQAVINGDNAAIDSVEAFIQVQQRANRLNQAAMRLVNSGIFLQNFLWDREFTASDLQPMEQFDAQVEISQARLDTLVGAHPDVRKLALKGNNLELERKLRVEQLKPVINVNYNFLLTQTNPEIQTPLYDNNYKLGAHFAFPLLIRKERAKLGLVKIKQQETNLELRRKTREVDNKIDQSYNEVVVMEEMIARQEEVVSNYRRMLEAEQIKFNNGESSVFLINSRENKLLEGQLKLIELKAKYGRSIGKLLWSAGILYEKGLTDS